jgi:hypothetical protein
MINDYNAGGFQGSQIYAHMGWHSRVQNLYSLLPTVCVLWPHEPYKIHTARVPQQQCLVCWRVFHRRRPQGYNDLPVSPVRSPYACLRLPRLPSSVPPIRYVFA